MPRLPSHKGRSAQSPVETYLSDINETPLLTAEEERELAYRIEEGDSEAREQMVKANLRLVVNIARGYSGKGLDLQDLIEEGNLGLMRAAEGFDPSMNTRFNDADAAMVSAEKARLGGDLRAAKELSTKAILMKETAAQMFNPPARNPNEEDLPVKATPSSALRGSIGRRS